MGFLLVTVSAFVAGCSVPSVGGSADFVDTVEKRTAHVEVEDVRADDGALSIALSLGEEVDGGEVRETLDWVTLYFAPSKRTYFSTLNQASAPPDAWERYEIINVAGHVGDQELFTWKLDETQVDVPGGRPILATESTSMVLPSRIIRGNEADEFRQAVLLACPGIEDVVLERLILLPASVVVKLIAESPPSEESVSAAKTLVISDLLQEPSIAAQNVALALVEVYVAGDRVDRYSWDNWAEEWFTEDWSVHTFEGVAGE